MSESLFDFSKTISEQEFVTHEKVKNLIDSIHIDKIVCKKISNRWLKDFVITFPKKKFFFTVTLYGGGSSGMKLAYDSNLALGGYSSGTIVRFPIEINNQSGNIFAVVKVGLGGQSFNIEDKVLWNNGEYSNFDLISGSGENQQNSYQTEFGRKIDGSGGSILLESLSSYGGGKFLDQSIIEETSTLSYFGFKGSNSNNTSPLGSGEHRNYYAPYLSEYDGYHSLNGLGGDHLGDVDGEEDTGAGGAGNNSNSKVKRVGKGGNGACILEYEGKDEIQIYGLDYLYVKSKSNLGFDIKDETGANRVFQFEVPEGIYSISYLMLFIKTQLNSSLDANVLVEDSRLLIKMEQPWNINISESSGELLFHLGITNKDVFDNNQPQIAKIINGSYQKHFTKHIRSVCPIDIFKTSPIFD